MLKRLLYARNFQQLFIFIFCSLQNYNLVRSWLKIYFELLANNFPRRKKKEVSFSFFIAEHKLFGIKMESKES